MSLNFSWHRVRTVLLSHDKNTIRFLKDALIINFKYYQQSIILYRNGKGILFHPNDKNNRPIFKCLAPKDIQMLVEDIWQTYNTKIPINPKSN